MAEIAEEFRLYDIEMNCKYMSGIALWVAVNVLGLRQKS